MTDFVFPGVILCVWLANYLFHSTFFIVAAHGILDRTRWVRHPELRVLVWKLALTLPVASSSLVSFFDVPGIGIRVPLAESTAPAALDGESFRSTDGSVALEVEPIAVAAHDDSAQSFSSHSETRQFSRESLAIDNSFTTSELSTNRLGYQAYIAGIWCFLVLAGSVRLAIWLTRLRRLRKSAPRVCCRELKRSMARLRRRHGIKRRIDLLESDRVGGPMTAGVFRPFIVLPLNIQWRHAEQRDALLAHELVHVKRGDAGWNLTIQLIGQCIPFNPLYRFATRQLRREMDFVADRLAAPSAEARLGLAQSLVACADRLTGGSVSVSTSPLASCMASFDSMLGKRIERLLGDKSPLRPLNRLARLGAIGGMAGCLLIATSTGPRAIPRYTDLHHGENVMRLSSVGFPKRQIAGLAMAIGLVSPTLDQTSATADETAKQTESTALKANPDSIPEGLHGFNGVLLGRLAGKDTETGTFIVRVDAVTRVWENSRAEDPKSVVGKTVEVTGVFGKFLDVLVVTRRGETVEFECKYDDGKLVFPGEHLRKVAPYDPSDYPTLPEAFRGFRGPVTATILKKDPQSFEMTVRVDAVKKTWEGSKAKDPKSIEGKSLMLIGFWNRREAFHALDVGSKIEVGMRHNQPRSDHLNVVEFVRAIEGSREERDAKKSTMRTDAKRGFRGMLVGRVTEKDVERGTFTITVDAVPRVWENNHSPRPKALLGSNVTIEGVTGPMLDTLVVTKVGETVEVAALHDGESQMRVGEVLRKTAPVKPGDFPELTEGFRGFRGFVIAKVIRKDPQLMELIVEIKEIRSELGGNQAENATSMLGRRAMLGGFWDRKDFFHQLSVGDTIACGAHHRQLASDLLSVIEGAEKVAKKK